MFGVWHGVTSVNVKPAVVPLAPVMPASLDLKCKWRASCERSWVTFSRIVQLRLLCRMFRALQDKPATKQQLLKRLLTSVMIAPLLPVAQKRHVRPSAVLSMIRL